MEAVRVISPDLVLVDYGVSTLTISAWADEKPRPVMAAAAGALALQLVAQLADFQKYLAIPAPRLPERGRRPPVVKRAVEAARAVSDLGGQVLTPLAAVAGAVADELADAAFAMGADKVLVNNGGDVAVRLAPGQTARVGLSRHPGGPITHYLSLNHSDGVGGVATSGWRGRSFSPGVADQVGVWAQNSALADAGATWLAGAVTLDSEKVLRRPARELDPQSDLCDKPVTVEVGELSAGEVELALSRGEAAAGLLLAQLPVTGAQIWLGGQRRLLARSGPGQPALCGP